MPSNIQSKPTLRVGFRVPFHELEPEPFATFVHGSLHPIAKDRGWANLQQTGDGRDDGFDSSATNTAGHGVCIQCKRYATPLSLPHLGHELAKVALNTKLKGSTVSEHLLITSGTVREVLRSALRETSRQILKEQALQSAEHEDLRVLRQRATAENIDVNATVTAYVDTVELTVWSGREFDTQLGLVWDRLSGLLERVFVVQALVEQFPRPDFDEACYHEACVSAADPRFVDTRCQLGSLPHNVSTSKAGDPWRPGDVTELGASAHSPPNVLAALAEVSPNQTYLLIGEGGAGKTTALEHLRVKLLERRVKDEASPLPILVPLGAVNQSLDGAIHTALRIRRGHWCAIPGSFVLLLDGLDEVRVASLHAIVEELGQLEGHRVAVVATTRQSGPPRPIVMRVTQVFEALPFGPEQVSDLAGEILKPPAVAAFVDAWLMTVAGDSFLASPQAVAAALHCWSSNQPQRLPNTHRDLLDNVLALMSKREQERYGPLSETLGAVHQSVVVDFARRLVERSWFETGERTIDTEEYQAHLVSVLREARGEGAFGADAINTIKLEILLKHHGFVVPTASGARLPHETVCAFLSSNRLAKDWRQHINVRTTRTYDRSWLAAISLLADDELCECLKAMINIDIQFATRLAREAEALNSFVPELLNQARHPIGEYREAEVARALSTAGTPECIDRLQEWILDGGHRQITARRALASIGDPQTVREALTELDPWDSSPIQSDGEARSLWRSSPFTARLIAARNAVSETKDGLVGCSFGVLQTWGTQADAPAVWAALERNSSSLTAFRRGMQALHVLDPELCSHTLRNYLAEATDDSHVYLLEIAVQIGQPVDAATLVDYILAKPEPKTPPDPNSKMITTTSRAAHRRPDLALKLLEEVGLPPELAKRTLALIRSAEDPTVRHWAWSIARTVRLLEAIEVAQTVIVDKDASDSDLYYAVWMLAAQPAQTGLAVAARQRFSERFPGTLNGTVAYNLATLCEADDDVDGVLEITSVVWSRLAKLMESEDSANGAALQLHRWFDRVLAFPQLLREVGVCRIVAWDLRFLEGVDKFMKAVLGLAQEKEVSTLLSSLTPPEWRCQIIRYCCELYPGLRSVLELQIAELMLHFCNWRPPTNLVEAGALCWGDAVAVAMVEACIRSQYVHSRIAVLDRIDPYLHVLGPLFTAEQAETFITPAIPRAADMGLRKALQFWLDQAHRRR